MFEGQLSRPQVRFQAAVARATAARSGPLIIHLQEAAPAAEEPLAELLQQLMAGQGSEQAQAPDPGRGQPPDSACKWPARASLQLLS